MDGAYRRTYRAASDQPGQEKLLDERYEICRTEVQQERSYEQEGESWEPDYEP